MSDNSTIKRLPLEHRVALHGELIAHGILPTCLTCLHMPDSPEFMDAHCTKYNAKPPLKVIVTGCVGWEQDIPF